MKLAEKILSITESDKTNEAKGAKLTVVSYKLKDEKKNIYDVVVRLKEKDGTQSTIKDVISAGLLYKLQSGTHDSEVTKFIIRNLGDE